jgi:hypothetical protein
MPVTESFQITHQWVRELRRWRRGETVGIYFRIGDSQSVLVGRYNEEHREMTAAQAVAHVRSLQSMDGIEVVIPRRILPREIVRIRILPRIVGWRHYPDAHGKHPWSCPYCQRDSYGSRRIRDRAERAEIE